MPGPRPTTRAGSGLTVRKNSAATSLGSVRDLDLIEGTGILLTITHDRKLGIARVTVTSTTGPSADREVGITGADTIPAELDTKLVVTAPISKTIEGAGGDERLRITHGGQHNFTDLLGVLSDAQHGTRSGDLHPIYLTTAEADALYEVIGAVATHEAAGDPHAIYLTQTEADALYEALGAVAAHAAAADPHTGYQKESEKDAANGYPGLDATPKLSVAQIRGLRESGGQALDMGAVADGEYLKRSGAAIVGDTPAGGGATFLDLTDTPAAYAGQAHKGVKVNAGETGLEFVTTWPGLRHTFDEGVTAGKTILSTARDIGFATAPTIAGSGSSWAGFLASPVVSGALGMMQGLNFIVRCQRQDSGTVSYLEGCRAGWAIVDGVCSITNANGFVVPTPNHGSFGAHTIATSRGVHVQNIGNSNLIAKAIGLQIDDHSTAVLSYLLEIGPATPYLRLLGKAAPGAGLTNLYLNEGGTLRRVQQKAFSTLQAADRVMVLV